MAYDASLAERVRGFVGHDARFTETKMFGGVGFLLYGNMCVGIWNESLVLRVGVDVWESLLRQKSVGEFDITGRSMRGWVMVEPDGYDSDRQLEGWVKLAMAFTATLPPK